MTRYFLIARGGLALSLLSACGGMAKDRPDSARGASADGESFPIANPQTSAIQARDSVSAHAVDWTLDAILERLSSAGLSPQSGGSVRQHHMAVPGTQVGIPGAELEVYIYGDANATSQDIDRFDSLTVVPGDTLRVWRKPPSLIVADNMVIVVKTVDPALRRRIHELFDNSHSHQLQQRRP